MSPAPVFVRILGSHHPGARLRFVPGFRDPGSVLILGQVTQYGNPNLICITLLVLLMLCRGLDNDIEHAHKHTHIYGAYIFVTTVPSYIPAPKDDATPVGMLLPTISYMLTMKFESPVLTRYYSTLATRAREISGYAVLRHTLHLIFFL